MRVAGMMGKRRPLADDPDEQRASREDHLTIAFLGGVLVGIALMGLLAVLGRWLG